MSSLAKSSFIWKNYIMFSIYYGWVMLNLGGMGITIS